MARQINIIPKELNNWFYDLETTLNHEIALKFDACLRKFVDLYKEEGGSIKDFKIENINNFKIIFLDCVETMLASKEKRNKNKTMDFAMGLTHIQNKGKRMLLGDFKLNLKNGNNIRKKDIEEKQRNSKDILGNSIEICKYLILLVKKNKVNELRQIIRRKLERKKLVVVLDANEFLNLIFIK